MGDQSDATGNTVEPFPRHSGRESPMIHFQTRRTTTRTVATGAQTSAADTDISLPPVPPSKDIL